ERPTERGRRRPSRAGLQRGRHGRLPGLFRERRENLPGARRGRLRRQGSDPRRVRAAVQQGLQEQPGRPDRGGPPHRRARAGDGRRRRRRDRLPDHLHGRERSDRSRGLPGRRGHGQDM
ncbi:MAG: hypothetical protein AVDCRST_MAG91-13, partial [uncultured Sphingomonadaceae bacterium]